MWYMSVLMLCLCLPTLVCAEDVVCGDASQMSRYLRSIDPSRVTDPTCTLISKANTGSQRALVESLPLRYLKVIGGLATAKTQAEKDAADAVVADQQAASQVFVDEATNSDFCNTVTFATLENRLDTLAAALQTDIDATTNIATAKVAMTNMKAALVVGLKKTLKCLIARRFVR